MSDTIDNERAIGPGAARDTAGARLRAAREAAGLSIDAVAQQLKLAPRQVQALEDDDWERLPGRTFVRGFARNYARFLDLDPDSVIALLPASDSAPALSRPALAAARRPIGEMPIEGTQRASAMRWLLPLVIVAIVAGGAYYEYLQQHGRTLFDRVASGIGSTPAVTSTPAPTAGTATTTLPNPVSATATLPNPVGATTTERGGRDGATVSTPETSASPASIAPAADASTTASPAPPTPASPTAAPANAAAAGDPTLVLAFKGTSWAEVKDAHGRVILQMTGGAGMTQTVSGTPPLELALGNAPDVGVTFRGQALDLAPYTRGSVARVALR